MRRASAASTLPASAETRVPPCCVMPWVLVAVKRPDASTWPSTSACWFSPSPGCPTATRRPSAGCCSSQVDQAGGRGRGSVHPPSARPTGQRACGLQRDITRGGHWAPGSTRLAWPGSRPGRALTDTVPVHWLAAASSLTSVVVLAVAETSPVTVSAVPLRWLMPQSRLCVQALRGGHVAQQQGAAVVHGHMSTRHCDRAFGAARYPCGSG